MVAMEGICKCGYWGRDCKCDTTYGVITMSEKQSLEDAVDEFAAAMKKRLLSKQKQGWYGWDQPNIYNTSNRLLRNASQVVVRNDPKSMVDVANLAMMLWRKKTHTQ